ncbi:MAG: enoyl-CoA hydratase/isomerase family protein [Gammaproteobacteria bacterium]
MKTNYLSLSMDERGVLDLTLDRADKHNAFDAALIADMTEALDEIAQDANVRVMILSGNGKNFCAGADLDWMRRTATYSEADNLRDAEALALLLHKLDTLPVPSIARVHGAAMGGGCGLLSCCDLAIAADDANFAFSEVRVGLAPATISPYIIRNIGAKNARRYFLTAERFNAEQALAIGLVSEVVAADDIDAHIDTLVTGILSNSPAAVKAAKQLVFDVTGQAVSPELRQHTSRMIAELRASEHGKEGLRAFLEKRKPDWQQ